MQQYLDLLKAIKKDGVNKPPARENMPGTRSLFGYQFRHNLADGFPLLTTKKLPWKGVVVELLWFLRGDTNIKYLDEQGVTYMWHQDAYNYYVKRCRENHWGKPTTFEKFKEGVKLSQGLQSLPDFDYVAGDCGYQYGKVWRDFNGVDQIDNLINGLRNEPESRRHILTSIDPEHQDDLALYWCHALSQFNCRPLTFEEKIQYVMKNMPEVEMENLAITEEVVKDDSTVPKYYLDCHLYQRSADVFLGVPFNIASYALLTHILAGLCNMVPGHFIHSFGDVHIYDNHIDAVEEQLMRSPHRLPRLIDMDFGGVTLGHFKYFFGNLEYSDFVLEGYDPSPAIKAELSTGMKR